MDESSITSQIFPFIIAIFTSFLTVQFLYTITNQRGILCAIFLMLFFIVVKLKTWITKSLYPDRKDGKVHTQRILLVLFFDLLKSVVLIVLTKLVFDIFSTLIVHLTFSWYDYIVAFSVIVVFSLSIIISLY